MRTAARIARFSIVSGTRDGPEADRNRLERTDGTGAVARGPAGHPGSDHARRWPGPRTRNRSARSGNSLAKWGKLRPCISAGAGAPLGRSRRESLSGHVAKRLPHVPRDHRHGLVQDPGPSHYDQRYPGRGRVPCGSICLAQPPLHSVPGDGAPDLSADGEPHVPHLVRFRPSPENDHEGSIDSLAIPEQRLKGRTAGQALAAGQSSCYTVSRFRPLARRRLSTLRPP